MPSERPRARILAEQLDGRRIGDFKLKLTSVRPVKPRAGWMYFTLCLAQRNGATSRSPVMTGIVSGGGRGVQPWFECRLYPQVELASGKMLDARAEGLESKVVEAVGKLVPPGGHLMVDYENAGQEETFAELVLRVPPAASHLGALMFRAGFRGHFKDWYFSEGGHEGPRKLQANKSPNAAEARRALAAHREELAAFVKRALPERPDQPAVIRKAQTRARTLLKEMRR